MGKIITQYGSTNDFFNVATSIWKRITNNLVTLA